MTAKEIIKLVRELKLSHGTRDPFKLAEYLGIATEIADSALKDFKAHTLKWSGYPVTIVVNSKYTERSQRVLCAHELGHAILHGDSINYFAVTRTNAFTNVEYEANLFAVALLFGESAFNMPLEKMSNYTLKSILDYNIETK